MQCLLIEIFYTAKWKKQNWSNKAGVRRTELKMAIYKVIWKKLPGWVILQGSLLPDPNVQNWSYHRWPFQPVFELWWELLMHAYVWLPLIHHFTIHRNLGLLSLLKKKKMNTLKMCHNDKNSGNIRLKEIPFLKLRMWEATT